jgi:hypothetical protein
MPALAAMGCTPRRASRVSDPGGEVSVTVSRTSAAELLDLEQEPAGPVQRRHDVERPNIAPAAVWSRSVSPGTRVPHQARKPPVTSAHQGRNRETQGNRMNNGSLGRVPALSSAVRVLGMRAVAGSTTGRARSSRKAPQVMLARVAVMALARSEATNAAAFPSAASSAADRAWSHPDPLRRELARHCRRSHPRCSAGSSDQARERARACCR